MISIGQAAEYMGVSISTMRRYDRKGKLVAKRTLGNHRRYTYAQLNTYLGISEEEEDTCRWKKSKQKGAKGEMMGIPNIYARVSSYDQNRNGSLDRQVDHLKRYAKKRYGKKAKYHVIEEYGSGLNPNRRGLKTLIHAGKSGKCSHVIVMYRDRLTRFGFPFLESLFRDYKVGIRVIGESDDKTGQEQLTEDLMALIACFSGKMYKSRMLLYTKRERDDFKIDKIIQAYIRKESDKAFERIIERERKIFESLKYSQKVISHINYIEI